MNALLEIKKVALVSALLFALLGTAEAQLMFKPYVGLGFGISDLDPETNDTPYSVKESQSSGFQANLGARIAERWAVEFGYFQPGEATMSLNGVEDPNKVKYQFMSLSALYFPLAEEVWGNSNGFGVAPYLGLGLRQSSIDWESDERTEESEAADHLILGLDMPLNRYASLRLIYDRFSKDAQMFSLGIKLMLVSESEETIEEVAVVEDVEPVVEEQAPVAVVVEPEPEPEPPAVWSGLTVADNRAENNLWSAQDLMLVQVYFDKNSSLVTDSYQAIIKQHADYMNANPGATLELQGFADIRGSADYNRALALRRCEAIKASLVNDYGVSANRISSRSFGESNLLDYSENERSYRKSRRVEFAYR